MHYYVPVWWIICQHNLTVVELPPMSVYFAITVSLYFLKWSFAKIRLVVFALLSNINLHKDLEPSIAVQQSIGNGTKHYYTTTVTKHTTILTSIFSATFYCRSLRRFYTSTMQVEMASFHFVLHLNYLWTYKVGNLHLELWAQITDLYVPINVSLSLNWRHTIMWRQFHRYIL